MRIQGRSPNDSDFRVGIGFVNDLSESETGKCGPREADFRSNPSSGCFFPSFCLRLVPRARCSEARRRRNHLLREWELQRVARPRLRTHFRGRSQPADVCSGGSYSSSSDQRIHFGLGTAAAVDSVEIYWPSGTKQKIVSPCIDRILTIEEDKKAGEKDK
jgi:ASPIC and UnbV